MIGPFKISSDRVDSSSLIEGLTTVCDSWVSSASYKRLWKCFIQSSGGISELSSNLSLFRSLFISFQNSPLWLEFKVFVSFKSWFLYLLYVLFASFLYFFLRTKCSCRNDWGVVGFILFASFCSFFLSASVIIPWFFFVLFFCLFTRFATFYY